MGCCGCSADHMGHLWAAAAAVPTLWGIYGVLSGGARGRAMTSAAQTTKKTLEAMRGRVAKVKDAEGVSKNVKRKLENAEASCNELL